MTTPAMRAKYIAHEALFARERIEERDGIDAGILDIDIEEFIEKFALGHIEAAVLQERNAFAERLSEIMHQASCGGDVCYSDLLKLTEIKPTQTPEPDAEMPPDHQSTR